MKIIYLIDNIGKFRQIITIKIKKLTKKFTIFSIHNFTIKTYKYLKCNLLTKYFIKK